MIDSIISTMEIIGTITFAISGALVAVGCGLDVFGVVFIGCITATGGGIIRDILIGQAPPTIFSDMKIFIIAVIVPMIVFAISYIYKSKFNILREKIERINNIFDAIGLSAFSVTGTEIVLKSAYGANAFLAITLGIVTGVGGGALRDVLTDTTPFIFKKHIYALASFLGSLLYYIIKVYSKNDFFATILSCTIVVIIRILASKYLWKLPRIDFENSSGF